MEAEGNNSINNKTQGVYKRFLLQMFLSMDI